MKEDNHLYILWTTGDVVTAERMVLMYAGNSLLKGWWEKVTVILWGAADQLACENPAIQERMQELTEMGVHFTACQRCAETLSVAEKLKELGVELRYWGEPLTALLKSGAKLLTV